MVCMEEHKMETENENEGSNNYRTLYKVTFYLQTWQPIAAFQFSKVHVDYLQCECE